MPSRRKLASISFIIATRDKPLPLGPGRILPCTLVAMTTSSREAKSLMARPRISSLLPREYTFAVSKKLIPASSARWMKGRLAASSIVHGWVPCSEAPKLMHPKQIRDTCKPVSPRFTYFIDVLRFGMWVSCWVIRQRSTSRRSKSHRALLANRAHPRLRSLHVRYPRRVLQRLHRSQSLERF